MGDMSSCSTLSALTKNTAIKEKVRLVAVGTESCTIVLENNEVHYKGSSSNYHFKNDESKSSFCKMVIWPDVDSQQKIVDIASGSGFTICVTDIGEVWAWGKEFLDPIEQSSETPIQVKKPKEMLAKRCWANKFSDSHVAFVEFEDQETKKKYIYSAGFSENGLLGQGDKIKESREFKKINYLNENIEYE